MTEHEHFHVVRHNEDDDEFVTTGIAAAIDYAAMELEMLAGQEHEMVRTYGERGLYKEAYFAWDRSEEIFNLHENAANIAAQYAAKSEDDRAPLYQGPGWEERLAGAARHMIAEIGGCMWIALTITIHADPKCEALVESTPE